MNSQSTGEAKVKIRSDIQVLRGIAVIAVVLFHAFPEFFPNGYLGVDLFFVISGYVVTPLIVQIFSESDRSERNQWARLLYFYKKRMFRLVPALLVALLISGISLFFFGQLPDQDKILKQGISAILFLGNIGAFKFNSNYFAPNPNPLIHTWSLSVEMQFYFLIPIALLILSVITKKIQSKVLFFYCFISLMSLFVFIFPAVEKFLAGPLNSQLIGWEYFSPLARAWEFLFGGIAALVAQKHTSKSKPKVMFLVLTCLIFLLFVNFPTNRRLTTFCVVLLGALVIQRQYFYFSPNSWLRKIEKIGDYSYSIYLYHLPLIYLADFGPLFSTLNQPLIILKSCVAISVSVLLGKLSHEYVESRFRLSLKGNVGSSGKVKALAWATISSMLLYFAMIFGNNGYFFADQLSGVGKVNSLNWIADCNWDTFLKPCVLNSPDGKVNQLLIGDSMAASVSRTVYEVGAEKHLNTVLYSKSSCPYLLKNIKPLNITKDCIIHNRNISNVISKYSIQRVIYFQSSSDRAFSSLEQQNQSFLVDKFESEVLNNLDKLNIPNLDILIMGFTPSFNDGNQSRAGYILGKRLHYSDTTQEADTRWRNRVENRGFNFLDSYSVLCPANLCKSKLRVGWILSDNHHLSIEGANLLKSSLRRSFDGLIKAF